MFAIEVRAVIGTRQFGHSWSASAHEAQTMQWLHGRKTTARGLSMHTTHSFRVCASSRSCLNKFVLLWELHLRGDTPARSWLFRDPVLRRIEKAARGKKNPDWATVNSRWNSATIIQRAWRSKMHLPPSRRE